MKRSLVWLLKYRGDVSFPHAPVTTEELLLLFRSRRSDSTAAALAELVRADPGLAFNLARLLKQDGMPLRATGAIDLRDRIERFNVHKAIAVLAPNETVGQVFEGALEKAYCGIAAAAVHAAEQAYASGAIQDAERDLAALMALGSGLGLLGLANLVEDEALSVLVGGDSCCQEALGFRLDELSAALAERYAFPTPVDARYSPALRSAVADACRGSYLERSAPIAAAES